MRIVGNKHGAGKGRVETATGARRRDAVAQQIFEGDLVDGERLGTEIVFAPKSSSRQRRAGRIRKDCGEASGSPAQPTSIG